MRVYSKLSVVVADDAGLTRRQFSVEDVEENDDTSLVGGGSPVLAIPSAAGGGASGVTVDLQGVTAAKQVVLLVDGSVNVFINNSVTAIPVASSGTGKTFVWGKFLLTGTAITGLKIVSASTSAGARALIGFAG